MFWADVQTVITRTEVLIDSYICCYHELPCHRSSICLFIYFYIAINLCRHVAVSLELVVKLVRTFGPVIHSTVSVGPSSVGVDLEAEQRYCFSQMFSWYAITRDYLMLFYLSCHRRRERCNLCFIELEKVKNKLPSLMRYRIILIFLLKILIWYSLLDIVFYLYHQPLVLESWSSTILNWTRTWVCPLWCSYFVTFLFTEEKGQLQTQRRSSVLSSRKLCRRLTTHSQYKHTIEWEMLSFPLVSWWSAACFRATVKPWGHARGSNLLLLLICTTLTLVDLASLPFGKRSHQSIIPEPSPGRCSASWLFHRPASEGVRLVSTSKSEGLRPCL